MSFLTVATMLGLLGCASVQLTLGAMATRRIVRQNDVLEASLSFPAINNRTFDSWTEGIAEKNFQDFRQEVVNPQLFQLLEEGKSYAYNSSYLAFINDPLNLIGLLFTSKWGSANPPVNGSSLSSAIYWLKEQKEVNIIDIFIDPQDLYQVVATFSRKYLADRFPLQELTRVIQPDSNHIRHLLPDSQYLVALWPTSAFLPGSNDVTRVNIPWRVLLGEKPLQQVIAREFLSNGMTNLTLSRRQATPEQES